MRVLPGVSNIGQMAFVVGDLERALATWTAFGIAPWRVYTFSSDRLPHMTISGRAEPHAARRALCSLGATTYELIEPLHGPSIYAEHLERCGAGLHHLGSYVDDIDAAVAAMTERGYEVLQAGDGFGVNGDGAYADFDTAHDVGCMVEAVVGPQRMPEPESIYPMLEPS